MTLLRVGCSTNGALRAIITWMCDELLHNVYCLWKKKPRSRAALRHLFSFETPCRARLTWSTMSLRFKHHSPSLTVVSFCKGSLKVGGRQLFPSTTSPSLVRKRESRNDNRETPLVVREALSSRLFLPVKDGTETGRDLTKSWIQFV